MSNNSGPLLPPFSVATGRESVPHRASSCWSSSGTGALITESWKYLFLAPLQVILEWLLKGSDKAFSYLCTTESCIDTHPSQIDPVFPVYKLHCFSFILVLRFRMECFIPCSFIICLLEGLIFHHPELQYKLCLHIRKLISWSKIPDNTNWRNVNFYFDGSWHKENENWLHLWKKIKVNLWIDPVS